MAIKTDANEAVYVPQEIDPDTMNGLKVEEGIVPKSVEQVGENPPKMDAAQVDTKPAVPEVPEKSENNVQESVEPPTKVQETLPNEEVKVPNANGEIEIQGKHHSHDHHKHVHSQEEPITSTTTTPAPVSFEKPIPDSEMQVIR